MLLECGLYSDPYIKNVIYLRLLKYKNVVVESINRILWLFTSIDPSMVCLLSHQSGSKLRLAGVVWLEWRASFIPETMRRDAFGRLRVRKLYLQTMLRETVPANDAYQYDDIMILNNKGRRDKNDSVNHDVRVNPCDRMAYRNKRILSGWYSVFLPVLGTNSNMSL